MSDTERPTDDDLINDPLTPTAGDGEVVVKDPPEAAMRLTPDAADMSAIRLLDAADKARKREP